MRLQLAFVRQGSTSAEEWEAWIPATKICFGGTVRERRPMPKDPVLRRVRSVVPPDGTPPGDSGSGTARDYVLGNASLDAGCAVDGQFGAVDTGAGVGGEEQCHFCQIVDDAFAPKTVTAEMPALTSGLFSSSMTVSMNLSVGRRSRAAT